MSAFEIAWSIILVSGLVAAFVLSTWLRSRSRPLVRRLIVAFALTFFVVPAPVPNYPEQWAPAFMVLIFEVLFQTEGAPADSVQILLMSLTGVLVSTGLVHILLGRIKSKSN